MPRKPEARLGLATTGELLAELQARMETIRPVDVDSLILVVRLQERLPVEALEYRTSDAS